MPGVIATVPKYQFSDSLGAPLAGGSLTTYVAGTNTLTNTWQDQAQSTLNTNPILLDARGECLLWLSSTVNYKFVLKNAAGVTQWTVDNISGSDSGLRDALAASSGASLVGYLPAGTGAVATTVQKRLQAEAWLVDFLPSGYVLDGSVDYSTYIQAAAGSALTIHCPEGIFKCGDIYFSAVGTTSYNGTTYGVGPRFVGAGKLKTKFVGKADATYVFASRQFGVRADATPATYTLGYAIENCTIDINAMSNVSTVAAIAMEDTWDVSIKDVLIEDSLLDVSNRWGLWFGRAVYTSGTDRCNINRILHKGNAVNGPANFGTTITHFRLSSCTTEHYYYQMVAYDNPTMQFNMDKFVLGASTTGLVLLGGDYENGGDLIKCTVDQINGVYGYGCTTSAMTGNLFGGTTQSGTGTARPGACQFDFEMNARAARDIASASRTGTLVTVNLVLTNVNGFFKFKAPAVGEIITVAGTGTAMDGTGFVVASSTMTYPGTNQITYNTVSSGSIGAVTTGSVTPDGAVGYRYSGIFGNYFRWDPTAARLLARQRIVLNNQTYLSGFKADGTTEVPLIGVDAAGRLSMTDGSTYQYIDDVGNFRNTKAGKGFTVTSPDGLTTKTITISNAGAITLI